jgi:hypothetical protein
LQERLKWWIRKGRKIIKGKINNSHLIKIEKEKEKKEEKYMG